LRFTERRRDRSDVRKKSATTHSSFRSDRETVDLVRKASYSIEPNPNSAGAAPRRRLRRAVRDVETLSAIARGLEDSCPPAGARWQRFKPRHRLTVL
jgi:hypothetical protein